MKNKKHVGLLLLIFFVAFFLRFYKLGAIPNGLYQDETAIGYNAYSILKTGKDEYGKKLPLYFKSFGDQKLPVYIYSDIIPIQLFGMTAFAVRFPSAFFGFLTVVIFYFFVQDLTKNKTLALVSTALLAVNPWNLHYSRATFEVSISLFFFTMGGYLLNLFFRKKLTGTFLLATVCFIVGLYTYNLTRLLSILLFALFLFLNKKEIKQSSKREMVITGIISFILLIPFFASLRGSGGVSSASGTLLFSSAAVLAPMHELRAYVSVLPSPFAVLFFNKYLLMLWQYINNIFAYFSVEFFFISGSPHGNHGIGNVGLFYLFELPLVIAGSVSFLKKRTPVSILLFGWVVIVILVAALTRDVPHATRSFFLIIPIEILSAAGLLVLYNWIRSRNSQVLKYSLFIVGVLFITFNLIYYFTSYYVRFPILYVKQWRESDKELSHYIKDHEKEYNKIIFDKESGFIYTSLLFYDIYPPEDFQKNVVRQPDDSEGFSDVSSFGKYEFRAIDWKRDTARPKQLIITSLDKKPVDAPAYQMFFYPKRPVAFAVKQEIVEYPTTDVSYVLVQTK